ncbi:NAD(P)/FAD-dependent oxidoreductase [Geomicrobium sp. JCM 19038]|uniref:flavin-containing monooxygenase n=1 Tax=Geomicrobium sp. JCM 19038 TaxID=1460635 RepID=UPI00045F2662|nr:NAD(P)/FAD-dependent oxidoreductase [Geomicrobium sp. JCM 19038]GAK08341.1 cyclohexanone monooxygenase [Geomicrobium sp. JCM 19038]
MSEQTCQTDYDVLVVGAGFSGLYAVYRFHEAGFTVQGFERADDVGGVWHWNRYPGAKCDSESIYYNFTFSEELYQKWTWSSRFASQKEILRYLHFVAEELDVKKHFQFQREVVAAFYEDENELWKVHFSDGEIVTAKYFIAATGCLSKANVPPIPGFEQFEGEWYHTGDWPVEEVDFQDQNVAVIGTGSSGVQAIPVIAKEAKSLTVFQRTPQYAVPANNYVYEHDYIDGVKNDRSSIRELMYSTRLGMPTDRREVSALDETKEQREIIYEHAWNKGGFVFPTAYNDLLISEESNATAASFIRKKIRSTVRDEDVAEQLCPEYYYAAKRPIFDSGYYETFNEPHVSLVDVKQEPIEVLTKTGIQTTKTLYDFDKIVFATGYDGITGSLFKMNIHGRNGQSLQEHWQNGEAVQTYLGVATDDFPNFFMITGPQSPSVLMNMPVAIEQHVDFITDLIMNARKKGSTNVEVVQAAVSNWSKECKTIADYTLYVKTDSWYTGTNIENRKSRFPIFVGGFPMFKQICDHVIQNDFEGFVVS